ncbi:hypothetical protein NDU88_001494 [Pleurodeles waltl]|uniref:Uncharacterized protein n=1 Tax=Pleurodeles waltl TaxID=8319 RepID=A0AAV7LDC0_PLEWA|nr:hypothetical protein NDU88_001494 [Pleurodeles waltl]
MAACTQSSARRIVPGEDGGAIVCRKCSPNPSFPSLTRQRQPPGSLLACEGRESRQHTTALCLAADRNLDFASEEAVTVSRRPTETACARQRWGKTLSAIPIGLIPAHRQQVGRQP